ncbi:hypothetical protein CLV92_105244 [Kineococcus xinjiangensis]|uniref:Uncharacterized protein n=1 Tax=Kineococcus xinjiangensis TaxID=512762 RepID=A0A2S6IPG1_9ACTN|nr:hypothetical protein [Kineococcus xinjiangensis]PPK96142.1 hypothetical protein CLV92_105244 [Kineococcus xinjiangensis]
MPDVFKILKDLELKAVGLDEQTKKMQEGYFVAFRNVGLPIRKQDFDRPFSPLGSSPRAEVPPTPDRTDPADAPKTASGALDPEKVYDDALLADVSRAHRAYVNTFMLTDSKLNMSADYSVMPGASKVSDSWWAITTGANGIPRTLDLDPALQAEYDKAQAVLMDTEGEITRKYERYLEYQDEYRGKVRAYNKAYANAFTDPRKLQQWPMEGKLYKDEVDEALDRWESFGHRQTIENAMAILAARGTDPAIALIGRAKKKLNGNLFNFPGVGNIPYTMMLPSDWADPDNDEGWTQYSSRDFHSETHYASSSTSFGGSAGINVGFWSADAGFSHNSSKSSLDISTSNLEVRFSYCVVDIVRPWLDTSLLNLDNWFLYGDYPAGTISSGTMNQEKPATNEPTFLPSIVTSLILVKDLRITWDDWKSQWDSKTSSTRAEASFGYGPFAVKGHYGKDKHSFDASTDDEGEGLVVEGIQLVGYVSQINPLSPRKNGADFLNG